MPSYVKVVSDLEYNTLPSPASRKRLAAAVSGTSSDNNTAAAETNKDTIQEKMILEGAPSNNGDAISNDTKLPSTNTNVTTNNTTVSKNSNPNPTATAAGSDNNTVNNNIDSSNYSQAAINWADKMKHKSTTNTVVAANNTAFTNDTVSNELAAQLTAQPATQQTSQSVQQTQQRINTAVANKPAQQPQISNAATNAINGLAPPPNLPQNVQQPVSAPNSGTNSLALSQSVQPPAKQNSKVQKTNKKSKSNKSIAEQAMAALNDDHSSSDDSSESDDGTGKDGDMNEDVLLNEAAGVLNGVNKESGRDSVVESDNNSIITQPPSVDEAAGLKKNVNGGLSSKGATAVHNKQSTVDTNGVAAAVNAVQEMYVDMARLISVDNNKDSAMEVEKDSAMEVVNIDEDEEEDNNTNSFNNSSTNKSSEEEKESPLTKTQAAKTLFNIGPLSNEYKKNMVLPENYTRMLMVILKELAVTLADLVSFFSLFWDYMFVENLLCAVFGL